MTHDSWDRPNHTWDGLELPEKADQPWPTEIWDPVNAFHPEEERRFGMTYEIGNVYSVGDMYEIGDEYMISGPQYAIGAPPANQWQQYVPAQYRNGGQMPRVNGNIVPTMSLPRPTIVRKKDPTESRLQPMGCNQEVPILVGAVGTATASPQKVFKAERFVVPDTVAPDFLIDSITVGVQLQSPANNSIPAQAFLPTSIYSNVDFDTCQISQQMVVRPRNIGGADRPFFSCFYGRVLQ